MKENIKSFFNFINTLRITIIAVPTIATILGILKNSLLPAVYSIIDTEGIIDLKVKGTAYFNLLGFSIPIPFESSKQISIYDEVRNKISAEVPLK